MVRRRLIELLVWSDETVSRIPSRWTAGVTRALCRLGYHEAEASGTGGYICVAPGCETRGEYVQKMDVPNVG